MKIIGNFKNEHDKNQMALNVKIMIKLFILAISEVRKD